MNKKIDELYMQYMRVPKADSFLDESIFNGPSPLRNYGYEVGHKSKLTQHQRRCKLLAFWTALYGDRITDPIKTEWGEPCSNTRIAEIAKHLRAMINLKFAVNNKLSYKKAIQDWIDDIDFLQSIYAANGGGYLPPVSFEIREFAERNNDSNNECPF